MILVLDLKHTQLKIKARTFSVVPGSGGSGGSGGGAVSVPSFGGKLRVLGSRVVRLRFLTRHRDTGLVSMGTLRTFNSDDQM